MAFFIPPRLLEKGFIITQPSVSLSLHQKLFQVFLIQTFFKALSS